MSYSPYKGKVQGLGSMQIIGKGTVHYYVNDDNGNKVQILISNVYHIPSLPVRLISPQQLAKQSGDPLAGDYTTKKDLIYHGISIAQQSNAIKQTTCQCFTKNLEDQQQHQCLLNIKIHFQ
eukprot:11218305-Ditylum_brightwellii.AAC.1